MPLTRITIFIPSITQVMHDYDSIRVYRAETEHGTYTEITTDSTKTELCLEQEFYDYDDESGSEYYWYKWKYSNSFADSKYYGPIQGYTPHLTYCTFEDVKRNLRSRGPSSGKVTFSDGYKNIESGRDNTTDIKLKEISISQDYSGEERFKLIFTSATEFYLEVGKERDVVRVNIGSGDINTDFISDDENIRIDSASWVIGAIAPVSTDFIEFETTSQMSINDAIMYIQDSEILVDSIIEENINFSTEKRINLRFERGDIPKTIKVATAKFAAFFIWVTIYKQQNNPGGLADVSDKSEEVNMSSWFRQGMKYLEGFIKKYTERFDIESGTATTSCPRWRSMDSLFDAVGVAYVGEGLKLPELDSFKERSQMSYEGLLDYDLLLPGGYNLYRNT